MKSVMKKAMALGIIFIMLLLLGGCTAEKKKDKADVARIEWSDYDELLARSASEVDPERRALILHQAEDMLLDTGCLIPLFHSRSSYLKKPDIEGVYLYNDQVDFSHIRKAGADKISINISTEISNADPMSGTTADLISVCLDTYARLLKVDETGAIVPDLAESYTVSEDGLTYEFILRDDLKWSDGSGLDAHDFEYSWKRAASSQNGFEYGSLYDCIVGYPDDLDVHSSEDGKKFTVRLSNPCAYFTGLCTFPPFSPVKQEQVENAAGYKDAAGKVVSPSAWGTEGNIISCGPYVLGDWTHNQSMTLMKNPYYYDADSVVTETVELMLTSDSAAAYSAYQSGAISLMKGKVPSDILPTLINDPEFYEIPQNNTASIAFNCKSEFFAGMTEKEAKTFRKALGYVVDREFIVKVALTGMEEIALTYVPKGMHCGEGKLFGETEGYEYPYPGGYYPKKPDLDKAREMLESIGYEFGDDGKLKTPVYLEYMYNSAASNEAVAVALQADFAQLGIVLTPTVREWNVYIGEMNTGNFECGRDQWSADYDDPYGMLNNYKSDSGNNKAQLGK